MEILSIGGIPQSDDVRLVASFDCPFLAIATFALVRDNDARGFAIGLAGEDMALGHAGDVECFAHTVKLNVVASVTNYELKVLG